jgi:hypothetical protein
MKDFRKMIFPLFYLMHGEKYKDGLISSYDCSINDKISVKCRICNIKAKKYRHKSYGMLFKYEKGMNGDPINIKVSKNNKFYYDSLHYETDHQLTGLKLYSN